MSVTDNLLLGGYLHRREKDAVRKRKRDLDAVYGLSRPCSNVARHRRVP